MYCDSLKINVSTVFQFITIDVEENLKFGGLFLGRLDHCFFNELSMTYGGPRSLFLSPENGRSTEELSFHSMG
jgi:hypothetical protein